jgi:capsular polysaccharide transport system permease protein
MPRTPLAVTVSVWRALFLREALARMSAGRAGWMWLLLEPVAHVAFLMLLFSTLRQRELAGVDFALFLALGLTGFRFFTTSARRGAGALAANRGLLAYRQVKPVDTVLVRVALEGMILVFVIALLLAGAAMFGVGLALCVGVTMVPEIDRIVGFVFTPLYFASGVFFSPAMMPPRLQEFLLYNPLVHGLELVRGAFFPGYHLVQGIELGYLAAWALGALLFGLALHRRFARELAAR